jgi:NAD+ synthase
MSSTGLPPGPGSPLLLPARGMPVYSSVMRAEAIAAWMRQQVNLSNSRGLVVGLSGGIDSAVVARLCQMATPGQALGVILPCHSDPRDQHDARLAAEHFKLPCVTIPLEEPFDAFTSAALAAVKQAGALIQGPEVASDDLRAKVPTANVKPRLRMASLYFVANRFNYLVAGTGNRCELAIGYFTKYGDGGVDLLPLGRLLKSEVRAMAREIGVPGPIIEKAPSAGLWLGQTDEGEMGFTYAELEAYLQKGPDTVAPAIAMRIERLTRESEHKRQVAPMPPV